MNEQAASAIAARIVTSATAAHVTLAGAESCTGGWIAKLLTDIPGSSAVFCGACVTYTNEMKKSLLSVPQSLLDEHTEVSHACAKAMAEGARRTMGSTIAYSTTGYAGPGGGTAEDPVGTVYLAISCPDGTQTHRLSLSPNHSREEIRLAAAIYVLEHLEAKIQKQAEVQA